VAWLWEAHNALATLAPTSGRVAPTTMPSNLLVGNNCPSLLQAGARWFED